MNQATNEGVPAFQTEGFLIRTEGIYVFRVYDAKYEKGFADYGIEVNSLALQVLDEDSACYESAKEPNFRFVDRCQKTPGENSGEDYSAIEPIKGNIGVLSSDKNNESYLRLISPDGQVRTCLLRHSNLKIRIWGKDVEFLTSTSGAYDGILAEISADRLKAILQNEDA